MLLVPCSESVGGVVDVSVDGAVVGIEGGAALNSISSTFAQSSLVGGAGAGGGVARGAIAGGAVAEDVVAESAVAESGRE